MVNTFLVNADYRISASCLDRARLGKQRVEAYQILIALRQLRWMADYFGLPQFPIEQDTPKEERDNWITQVLAEFKRRKLVAVHLIGRMAILIRDSKKLPKKPVSGHTYEQEGNIVYEYKGEKLISSGYTSQYVLPGEELITTGFRKHPAVSMWLGFESSLTQYINAHIQEWIARGYQNTMEQYEEVEFPQPPWTYLDEVHVMFMRTLLQRELERQENLWYARQDNFVNVWCYSDYVEEFRDVILQLPDKNWNEMVTPETLVQYGSCDGLTWL